MLSPFQAAVLKKPSQNPGSEPPSAKPTEGRRQKNAGPTTARATCVRCSKAASTVCAGCERPICQEHTILIRVGPAGADVLNLEICGSCPQTKALAPKAASA